MNDSNCYKNMDRFCNACNPADYFSFPYQLWLCFCWECKEDYLEHDGNCICAGTKVVPIPFKEIL